MELRPNSTAQFLFIHCTHCNFCKLTKTANISQTNPFLIDNTFHSPTHAKQNRFFADPKFFFFFPKLHKITLSSTLRSRWTLRWRPPVGSPPLILARKDVVSALYFFLQMNYVFQSQLSLTHTHAVARTRTTRAWRPFRPKATLQLSRTHKQEATFTVGRMMVVESKKARHTDSYFDTLR